MTPGPADHRTGRPLRHGDPLGGRTRASPPRVRSRRGDPWRSGPSRRRSRGRSGPGPVHLNLEFREPLTGRPAALPARPGPGVVAAEDRPAPRAGGAPAEAAGSSSSGGHGRGRRTPTACSHWRNGLAGRSWPTRVGEPAGGDDRRRRFHRPYEPPLPETIVMLGTPWLSRALGDVRHRCGARRRTGRRRRSLGAVGGSASSGDRVPSLRSRCLARRRARQEHRRVTRNGSSLLGAARGQGAGGHRRRARDRTSASRTSPVPCTGTPPVAVPPSWWRRPCRSGISSGSPRPRPFRPGCWPTEEPTGSTASCRRRWGSAPRAGSGRGHHTIALLGDLAFLHDVSGLVNLPTLPCTFVVVDNGGGGIFSFLPQATSTETSVFERLFGTPPTSDIAAVACGFGSTGPRGDLVVRTGAGARRASARPGAGDGAGTSRERRPARRDQRCGPSRVGMKGGGGGELDERTGGGVTWHFQPSQTATRASAPAIVGLKVRTRLAPGTRRCTRVGGHVAKAGR